LDFLSIFALIILIVLAVAVVAIWIMLAIWPGRIAKERGHKQADSVRVCGYWGALTLGILMPLAFIWAYWDHGQNPTNSESEGAS
jgi:uncharacterized BrkB/YihY/UPF0761 family membrane protein